MTLACRAGFDFCRELIRDIINELVDDDVTIQVYVITGDLRVRFIFFNVENVQKVQKNSLLQRL